MELYSLLSLPRILWTNPLEEIIILAVIHDPPPTRESIRIEFGALHPNNVVGIASWSGQSW